MLFKVATLDGIVAGRITLAFRRWHKPTVVAGSGLRTPVGVLRIGTVEPVDEDGVTHAEARAAGYADRAALLADQRAGGDRHLYRIAILGVEADHRIALRDEATLSDADRAVLSDRFARWEKTAPGHYPAILRAIAAAPGTSSTILADRLGVERTKLKPDIRKLKELGLTESLETGYRLSPRGEAVLLMLDDATQDPPQDPMQGSRR